VNESDILSSAVFGFVRFTFLDRSVAMEKNKIQNKQSSVTSIKWLYARCGNCDNGR
jgi:hypothetical protein